MTAVSPPKPPAGTTPRWWRWKRPRRLTCALGHHYPYKFRIPERGGVRCEHWMADEKRECGRWTYFIGQKGGGVFAVDVTLAELDELENLRSKTEVIDFLGIF